MNGRLGGRQEIGPWSHDDRRARQDGWTVTLWGDGLGAVRTSSVAGASVKHCTHPSERSRCASNNSDTPSKDHLRLHRCGLFHPAVACGIFYFLGNVIENLSESLPPLVPVKDHTLGGEPSGHGCKAEGEEDGEDGGDSRGYVMLKLRSATRKLRLVKQHYLV